MAGYWVEVTSRADYEAGRRAYVRIRERKTAMSFDDRKKFVSRWKKMENDPFWKQNGIKMPATAEEWWDLARRYGVPESEIRACIGTQWDPPRLFDLIRAK